jgi:hypothetical protein
MSPTQTHSSHVATRSVPDVITLTRKSLSPSRYCQCPRRTLHARTGQPIRMPCGRPRCSHECRDRWARKLATCLRRSFRTLPPTHEVRLTVHAVISDRDLSLAISSVLRRLRYRLGTMGSGCEYLAMNEWSEGHRHTHILLRVNGVLTRQTIRAIWAKTLPGLPFTCHCDMVRNPVGLANYMVKNVKVGAKKELAPTTFRGRLYNYSRNFFTSPVAFLWNAQLREWYPARGTLGVREGDVRPLPNGNAVLAAQEPMRATGASERYEMGIAAQREVGNGVVMAEQLKIDPEIAALLPPLTREELTELEMKVSVEGCRDPLVVWKETGILLDGHHRLAICKKYRLKYLTVELSFPTREQAIQWVIDNQLGRRNLTDERRAYYRGTEYRSKKQHHGDSGRLDGSPSGQNDQMGPTTAETLAAKHGVSEKTIRRDAEFAESVDKIGGTDPAKKEEILSGKSGQTKQQVISVNKPTILCARCKRVSPVEGCKACEEARKTTTGKNGKKHPTTTAQPAKRSKSGKPIFDDRKVTDTLALLVRLLGQRKDAFGKHDEHENCLKALDVALTAYTRWKKATT